VHVLFNQYGRSLIDEMQQENLIRKDSRVFDVGCGLGRLARVLTDFLSPDGAYYGIDANESSIDWCRKNYTAYPKL
jgi:ubiquinone/menaquinone biosynthesis C-methylase UbiE